jgi:asparagine synthase (glutamine-hydrolysing)
MIHRGPDDAGEWWSADGRVGLGHRRLSIIDLSSAGHQPMHDKSGEVSIVFNGEIYNYQELRVQLLTKGHTFSSHSDTEVILVAYREWGTECLSHLNGMFAFALFDARQQTVFLARDRAGEKPLFYRQISGELRFASELKALLADSTLPRRIEPEAMDCYLAAGYVSGERCILRDFNKLRPAHAILFHLNTGACKVWRYWQPPQLGPSAGPVDDVALLDELEDLIQDSVHRQMVADVPCGILLSGGVDSSLVAAMAARLSTKVKTFTIRFPGHSEHDETRHARLIAEHFDTEHFELEGVPGTADLMPLLARQYDEPVADSSMIPTCLLSKLVRQHCTVALGGDGGDELFGGYRKYSRMLWIESYLKLVPRICRYAVAHAAEKLLPVGLLGRNYLQGLGKDLESSVPTVTGLFDSTTRQHLMSPQKEWKTVAEIIIQGQIELNSNLLQRATRTDFSTYLPEDILVKVDRASMLSSLEVRAPFLDYRLIEFAFGKVPSDLKATPRKKKILLKRLAQRVLPPEFDRERKQGFSIPLNKWLESGPFQDLFHSVLLDSSCIFNEDVVDGLLRGQLAGRSNSERLFALVLFELWRVHYSVSV